MNSDSKLLEATVVNFFSGRKEFRSLSNFWEHKVVIVSSSGEQREYPSGEHCFHGEKYIRLSESTPYEARKQVLLEYGKTFMGTDVMTGTDAMPGTNVMTGTDVMTGAEVKKRGGKKGLLLTEEELKRWDVLSVKVQEEICQYKVREYEEVRKDLVKSGERILVHPALRCSEKQLGKRLWEGKGTVVDGKVEILGRNMLGNIWMKVRSTLL